MLAPCPELFLLCTPSELHRERRGYFDAFARLTRVHLLEHEDEELDSVARRIGLRPNRAPVVLLYPDNARSYCPEGLAELPWLTACFQIDSFSAPKQRAAWSRLFDVVFVFHPPSVQAFMDHGNRRVFLAPHGVRAEHFLEAPGAPRPLDVGFVGHLHLPAFRLRRAVLGKLEKHGYRMNDFRRSYDYGELASVYRSSRIGINIPQDSYLCDANLRAFEVMAGGALLLTPRPSELTDLGFRDGEHFATFEGQEELLAQVQHYLGDEAQRDRIASAGRAKTLAGFTYELRAREILSTLGDLAGRGERFRVASTAQVARIYLRHHGSRGQVRQMRRYLQRLRLGGELRFSDRRTALAGELRALRRKFRAVHQRIASVFRKGAP